MKITKSEFIKMHSEKSIKEMSCILGKSVVTIRKWAKRFNLPDKRMSDWLIVEGAVKGQDRGLGKIKS